VNIELLSFGALRLSSGRAPARMRFGSLLMVPGEIMGVHVIVLIDTGSDISLANQKFRDALRGVARARWRSTMRMEL
jgi:hypothetical protein